MKKFMRRHAREILIRWNAYGGRIRMLHSAAARSLSNVQNKKVMFKWRAIHQLQFVIANSAQVVVDLFLAPTIAMNHSTDVHWQSRYGELLKITDLDGCIRECVVVLSFNTKSAHSSQGRRSCMRGGGHIPRARNV